jgi:hypothetical protein
MKCMTTCNDDKAKQIMVVAKYIVSDKIKYLLKNEKKNADACFSIIDHAIHDVT